MWNVNFHWNALANSTFQNCTQIWTQKRGLIFVGCDHCILCMFLSHFFIMCQPIFQYNCGWINYLWNNQTSTSVLQLVCLLSRSRNIRTDAFVFHWNLWGFTSKVEMFKKNLPSSISKIKLDRIHINCLCAPKCEQRSFWISKCPS